MRRRITILILGKGRLKMKKVLLALLVVSMLALVPAAFAEDKPVAGVIWYNFADTFIQNAR